MYEQFDDSGERKEEAEKGRPSNRHPSDVSNEAKPRSMRGAIEQLPGQENGHAASSRVTIALPAKAPKQSKRRPPANPPAAKRPSR
jgi:hypothetical protein